MVSRTINDQLGLVISPLNITLHSSYELTYIINCISNTFQFTATLRHKRWVEGGGGLGGKIFYKIISEVWVWNKRVWWEKDKKRETMICFKNCFYIKIQVVFLGYTTFVPLFSFGEYQYNFSHYAVLVDGCGAFSQCSKRHQLQLF